MYTAQKSKVFKSLIMASEAQDYSKLISRIKLFKGN